MSEQSVTSKFAERVLVSAVNSIARAGAKFVESIAGDVKKGLRNEAAKAELLEQGVEWWRKSNLGEVSDMPASLQDDAEQKEERR
jgi:hypothetical protein